MSIIELSLHGEISNQQPFSIIPPVMALKSIIDYKKKCCDNCEYFDISINKGDSSCLKEVFNSFDTDCYIKDSDTFYCSYHKFKV